MKTSRLRSTLFCAALLLPTPFLFAADFIWTGEAGSSFSAPGNWESATVPAAGETQRCERFHIVNGSNAAASYTEKEGATVVECDDFKIGVHGRPGGSMLMSGGELLVKSRWAPMVAHHNNRTSSLTITGGRLTIRSAAGARTDEQNFRVGNWRGVHTRGVVNMSGGILAIETPGNIEHGGLIIANGDAHGEVLLEGGIVVVTSIYGTSFQPAEGSGVGVLTFGLGDGVFMQTDSKQLIFGTVNGGAASHINFVPGSRGQLSLAGATRQDYDFLVAAGRIRLAGQKTSPDKFKFTGIEGQGIYQLASDR